MTVVLRIAAAASLFAALCQAETVTLYNNQAAFDAAVGSYTVDTFGTTPCFAMTAPIDSSTNLPCLAPGTIQPNVTYSAATMSSLAAVFNVDSGLGFTSPFLDATNQLGINSLTATFTNPVSAVGFLTDSQIMGNGFITTIRFANNTSEQIGGLAATDDTAIDFFGFQSSDADIVSIEVQGSNFEAGYDDFTIATQSAAPEPSTLLLAAGALAGLAAVRRKNSRRREHVEVRR